MERTVTAGASMLPSGVTDIINQFASDIVPTVLAVVAIIVPVGLALWAMGFALKKGLSFLQKKASKAV